ncbi:cell death regulator Aven [Aplochiton taeniatus]
MVQDEDELEQEDEEMEKMFSRRKLESNWDRYEEPEKEEKSDDIPTQRGTDYHVLLETAGDSYSQFRFSDEKEWETDSFAASMLSAIPLDLEALGQLLEQLPLHERLNLEPELVQGSTPTDLPSRTMPPKQDLLGQTSMFKPPAPAVKGPSVSLGLSSAASPISVAALLGSSIAAKLSVLDIDEDLDQLLHLENPVSELAVSQPVCVEDKPAPAPAEPFSQESEQPAPEDIRVEPEGKEAEATPPKAVSVKQEVTEEDLEDWLDSMIS